MESEEADIIKLAESKWFTFKSPDEQGMYKNFLGDMILMPALYCFCLVSTVAFVSSLLLSTMNSERTGANFFIQLARLSLLDELGLCLQRT